MTFIVEFCVNIVLLLLFCVYFFVYSSKDHLIMALNDISRYPILVTLHLMTISHGCQIYHWDPLNAK